jgi:hypothetical protein
LLRLLLLTLLKCLVGIEWFDAGDFRSADDIPFRISLYILMFLSVYHYDCNANHYFKTLIVSYAIDLNVIVTI